MAFGGLLLAAVLLDDLADRVKLPGILLVLALGLLVDNDLRSAGEPLLSLTRANNITQSALVLVLFFGGLTTNWGQMRAVIRPAAWLATVGVLITAGLLTLIGIEMTNQAILKRFQHAGGSLFRDPAVVLEHQKPRRSSVT